MSTSRSIWDIYQERSKDIIVENIKKYVEAYADEWIAIHEALQNAIDAIQRSEKSKGTVKVEIWLDSESVRISDNGRGFPPELGLLCPGITDKNESGDTKGYQGVGLKALMYSTQKFTINSTYEENQQWKFHATNLYKLLENGEPKYESTETRLEDMTDTGTVVSYTFSEPKLSTFVRDILNTHYSDDGRWRQLYTHIRDENERKEKEISHVIEWYFRNFTYAADCNHLLDVMVRPNRNSPDLISVKPVEIEFVIYRSDDLSKYHSRLASYFKSNECDALRIVFPNKLWDFEEQVNYLRSQPRKYSSTAPLIEDFSLVTEDWKDFRARLKDRIYIRKLAPDYSKTEFDDIYAEYLSLVKRPRSRNVDWEQEFATLFSRVTGIYLVIGRTTLFERFGVRNRGERYIAANGIPTAHEITIRSTSSTWYLETIHFIVNVDERLNYGKKHISNTWLIGRVSDYFSKAYSKLMDVSKAFVREEDFRLDVGNEVNTDFISLPDLALPGINLVKEPNDENSLIFLFSQLLTYDPLLEALSIQEIELQIYGLLGKGIYDGKFRWDAEQKPRADSHLKSLEFKVSLRRLVDEFESALSPKEFRDTDLIVVWHDDLPAAEKTWKVRGVDEQKRLELDHKGIPSLINFVLEEDHSALYRPIIVVKYWIEEL